MSAAPEMPRGEALDDLFDWLDGCKLDAVDSEMRLAAKLEAAALRAKADLYECPECAFAYDKRHVLADGSLSCPVCSEHRLETELAALRVRVADLEMMLRAALHYEGWSGTGSSNPSYWEKSPMLVPSGTRFFVQGFGQLQDDGTGLPLLTDAARLALSPARGEGGAERG